MCVIKTRILKKAPSGMSFALSQNNMIYNLLPETWPNVVWNFTSSMTVDHWIILKRNFAVSQHWLFPNKTWQLLLNFLWDLMNRRLQVQSMKYICSEKAILSQTLLSKILGTTPVPSQPLWFCVNLCHLNLSVQYHSLIKVKTCAYWTK